MNRQYKDLAGKRFGRLIALHPTEKRKNRHIIWLCRCDCGNLITIISDSLIRERTKSCGCFNRERAVETNLIHGDSEHGNVALLYAIWVAMKQRCLNPNNKAYKYYGKRGIVICKEWLKNYLAFKWWAMSHGYKEGLTIDRIDSTGNYESSNCQWITASENIKKAHREKNHG